MFTYSVDSSCSLCKEDSNVFFLSDLINLWLDTLCPITKKNYSSGLNFMIKEGILNPNISLKGFSSLNHNDILEKIKQIKVSSLGRPLSEASKQARAACYISFTKFLNKVTQGFISQAVPSRVFGEETFYKVRNKVKTAFLSKNQWLLFFESLKKISLRDYIIGKLIIQGVKKISEILSLEEDQINFSQNKIIFFVKKRKSRYVEVVITYPISLMEELKYYLGPRKGRVFIKKTGEILSVNDLYLSFERAEKNLDLPCKVTPQVLRVSGLVHLKKLGYSDKDIMKVSGHSSLEMIAAYDTFEDENISSGLPLIF